MDLPAEARAVTVTEPSALSDHRSDRWMRAALSTLPWLLLLVLTGWTQLAAGTPARDLLAFAGFFVVGIGLPGATVWLLVVPAGRRTGSTATDLAIGTAIGYAIHVLCYAACAALRVPALGPWLPVLLAGSLVVATVTRRRRGGAGHHHRPSTDPSVDRPAPAAWSWVVCGLSGLLQLWLARSFLQRTVPVPDGRHIVHTDLVFTLALAGEAKWRWPLEAPWVLGESLHYHWFVAGHLASTSWATGTEPAVVLHRLAPAAFLLVLAPAVAAFGVRVAGRWWAGPVAVTLTLVAGELDPYLARSMQRGTGGVLGALLGPSLWWSPTQTFALVLSVPLLLMIVDLARDVGHRPAAYPLVVVLMAAVSAAKGTVLPVLIAGLTLAVVGQLVVTRRLHRPLVIVTGLAVSVMVAAQILVFGGGRSGLYLDPAGYAQQTYVAAVLRWATDQRYAQVGAVGAWTVMVLAVVAFTVHLLGAAALTRRAVRADPVVLVLGGAWLAGLVALVLLHFSGQSELFFLRAALPAAGALAAWGFTALTGRSGRGTATLVVAAGCGALGALLLRQPSSRIDPDQVIDEPQLLAIVTADHLRLLVVPGIVLLIAGVVALLAAGAARLGREPTWLPTRRPATLPLAVLCAAFAGIAAVRMPLEALSPTLLGSDDVVVVEPTGAYPSAADVAVLRRLRDVSESGDILATNDHCRNLRPRIPAPPNTSGACANTSFLVSAYAERRVLVEGWGYTQTLASRMGPDDVAERQPFWDQQRLADNDTVFDHPSAAAARTLRIRYGVRWLVAIGGSESSLAAIGRVAEPRWAGDHVAVFELEPR